MGTDGSLTPLTPRGPSSAMPLALPGENSCDHRASWSFLYVFGAVIVLCLPELLYV